MSASTSNDWAESAGDPQDLAGGLLGIFAHPDDEAFSMAGSLAQAAAAGRHTAILCATRGEAGEIADSVLATKETLGQVREGELRAACAAVGCHDVSFLGYVDGQLAEANPAEAVGRIVAHLLRLRPAVVVTFAANGVYGHPDHIAIHRLTLAAVEAAAALTPASGGPHPHRVAKVYLFAPSREGFMAMSAAMRASGQDFIPGGNAATIPLEQMGAAEAEITTRVPLSEAAVQAKGRALRAHASQMPQGNPFSNMNDERVRSAMSSETFILAPPPISARAFPTPETDLFAGLE